MRLQSTEADANCRLAVFDDEEASISRMYRDLECQHHLVQEHLDERPDIPGLTPVGFQKWVTLLIQAHPNQEFERLQKAVLAMPINNPDEKKERFPKELSRRLFPDSEDKQVRERMEKAISLHAKVDLPLRSNHRAASPKAAKQKASVSDNSQLPPTSSRKESNANGHNVPPAYVPSNIERERKPYSSIPESAIDDTNPTPAPPSNPIERERKPYSAQPGGGKQFEDEIRTREGTKPRSDSTSVKPQRSESTARARPAPLGQGQPDFRRASELPKADMQHHHRVPSNNAGRLRSPSFSNDYRRSDGDLRGYPPTFQPGSLPTEGWDEEAARRYARDRAERARRQADEDARSYAESPSSRRYERGVENNGAPPHRGGYLSNNEEDYYRPGGRGAGNGYDYQQPYGGPVYR